MRKSRLGKMLNLVRFYDRSSRSEVKSHMRANKLRPFVPSGKDYPQAIQFYVDLGFEKIYSDDGLAIFKIDEVEFHLQNYHNPELQNNFMLELCVHNHRTNRSNLDFVDAFMI